MLNSWTQDELARTQRGWIESQLEDKSERQEHFSNGIAVGSKMFVERVRQNLIAQTLGRRSVELPTKGKECQLKEVVLKYGNTNSEYADSDVRTMNITNAIPWGQRNFLKTGILTLKLSV